MSAAIDLAALRRQFLDAQLAGDRRQAVGLITAVADAGQASPRELRQEVIRPAQVEIGRLWEINRINVAQEHMATAISHLALAELFRCEWPLARVGKKVVVACVEGELHEFPARLVADELECEGFDVRFLGANVPTDHLAFLVTQEQPDLIVLSATLALHADNLRFAVASLRQMLTEPPPIAVGGQICEWVPGLPGELGVSITGTDAKTLVSEAKKLLEIEA